MLNSKLLIASFAQRFPAAVFFKEVKKDSKVIALTIDDVPARDNQVESIRQIIDVIEQHNITFRSNFKATFFVITSHLPQNAAVVQELTKRGHEIANHGEYDHRHASLRPDEFETEFTTAHHKLKENFGVEVRWFRPGQGFYTSGMTEMLKTTGQRLGYYEKFALASMIPFDTQTLLSQPKYTLRNLKFFTFPGAILLLHGGYQYQVSNTVNVLRELLPYLHHQGYEVVTLTELFSR